jgi:YidC/Oxa1 family membrane protein insertase
MGAFNACTTGERTSIPVRSERMSLSFNTQGAMIGQVVLADYQTYDKTPLELITPSDNNLNLIFSTAENLTINTRDLTFQPWVDGKPWTGDSLTVNGGDSLRISLRADISAALDSNAAAGKHYLEFVYTVRGDSYEVGFDINFVGLEDFILSDNRVDLQWHNRMLRQEQSREGTRSERTYTSIYYKPVEDDVDDLSAGNKDAASDQLKTQLEWVAFKQQYFSAILTAEAEPFENAEIAVHTNKKDTTRNYLTDMDATLAIPYSHDTKALLMCFYFGPTKFRDLRAFDRDFDKMLPLGWTFISKNISRWLIIPAFNFLEKFNWNYGIIIIIFTLLIRLLLLPLVYKSYRGGAIMRILKPEMDALNQRYPKKEQAMQKQQAMMALQKSAGYSPMAGCLPVLLQMPFLTAMFMFFPQAIELRQKSFLWCDDLSTYDSILDFGFNIPLYGDHISLFCLLMFGMQFFYTWYTMKQQAGTQSMPGMKFMMYFMPFMMLFIFNSQSAGLNLYYLVSLTFTMTTMILIRRFTNEKKVRARMAAYGKNNAGKPKKKSRFQQRLEEMQKQAEAMQKQREKQQNRR